MNEPCKYFRETFHHESKSKTDEKFTVIKNNVRLSLLTSRLLRVEIDRKGHFTDEPTQSVFCRCFDEPEFKVIEDGDTVILITAKTVFKYDTKKKKMLGISLRGGKNLTKYDTGNLKGTYRTLDMARGAIKLEDGIMSRDGVAVLDDTKSLLLCNDGTIKERPKTEKDEYYFAYNHDYRACLKDFYSLCGEVPLVPRYALGNWWSRYKAYTQQEYIDLMNNFLERDIPITVATIDMDWHWVDVQERFGKSGGKKSIIPGTPGFTLQGDGWTGYSWNTELFPDYKAFLSWLHEKNFKVTVNLHPAQGVRFFEDMYPEMAQRMGIDPESKKCINFDITDPDFVDGYFNILHKPYEKQGVDFWWIDWQQGKNSKLKGLDPLWALNHYHYLASAGEGKRPLILSRYAQAGSHRYPLGFSGDTIICWESLDFQPYFTNTAANIGYTWWSHDIGGHHMGSKNDEIYARWIQYGLYSPIMRLHSTSNEFMGKEPWKNCFESEEIAVRCLRERHAMIPYLYAMNYRTHKQGIALCEPMYYQYPEEKAAYEVKNQYFFGSELMVAPITSKKNPKTNLASVRVWLPKGRWTDIYTGNIYEGDGFVTMFRDIRSIPVLAKEGAIIPLAKDDRHNNWKNPADMTLRIFRGNNCFELYEDDGETTSYKNGNSAITRFKIREAVKNVTFTIAPAEGNHSTLPKKRNYTLIFEDISAAESIEVTVDGKKIKAPVTCQHGKIFMDLQDITPDSQVKVSLSAITARKNRDKREMVIELVTKYQQDNNLKKILFNGYLKRLDDELPGVPKCFAEPIKEILAMK
ncbi:MAG: glycoside hydrolase family 31 protein [Oscillospiraceae bacterium]|nr:glycoside hydrolase family 31 protein [Oscillospiraceae bacterium]